MVFVQRFSERNSDVVNSRRERTDLASAFIRLGARDNFYQSAAFIPMSFALVTTVSENGETGIGPHALCFPFSVSAPYSMLLISRGNSGTATNLRRSGQCALNYIEFDQDALESVAKLGYPGQAAEVKRSSNPFTLIPSPTGAQGDLRPRIIAEAFQVIECTWDASVKLGDGTPNEMEHGPSRFVLQIDHILLREEFSRGCTDGSLFPNMPIFYGFRAGGQFWFAGHAPPFPVAAPAPADGSIQAAKYLASRLDDTIRFTDDACVELAKIPRPFLSGAMQKLIGEARQHNRSLIDAQFMRAVREQSRETT